MARSSGTFKPGQSGNPSGGERTNGRWVGKVVHGFYKGRRRNCDACGEEYTARKLSSRFCSPRCATARGPWSYAANQGANDRAFGVTKS